MSPRCLCLKNKTPVWRENTSVSEFLSKRVDFKEMRIGREKLFIVSLLPFALLLHSISSLFFHAWLWFFALSINHWFQLNCEKAQVPVALKGQHQLEMSLLAAPNESLQTNNGNDSPFSLPRFLLLIRHWLQRIMDGQCVYSCSLWCSCCYLFL